MSSALEVREEQVVLEHDGDASLLGSQPGLGRRVVEHLAVELDAAGVDGEESGERTECRCLAGSVRSQERDGFAFGNVELDREVEKPEAQRNAAVQTVGIDSCRSEPAVAQ